MKGQEKIKHLYWRAGFGLGPEEWQKKKNWSIKKAVKHLFESAKQASNNQLPGKTELSSVETDKMMSKAGSMVMKQGADWISRMSDDHHSALLERMSLFWHGHFACQTKSPRKAFNQLHTIRKYALGKFREFVHAISKDVSMIRFLNNQENKLLSPNENFARELMELFTIGPGNYSEQDIKESARAFTGWSSNLQGEFVFRERHHDFGEKTFMGKTGNFNGDDIVNIILDRKETAVFITRKIYQYFVNEKVNESRVKQLADLFYKEDYNISTLMFAIFSSDWFYDKKNVGTKIKSPVELIAGIMRNLNVTFEDVLSIRFVQKALGQKLFDPPNVAGWAGGKSWIDNSTLMLRLNLVNYLYGKVDVNFKVKDELEAKRKGQAFRRVKGSIDFDPLIRIFDKKSNAITFEEMKNFLIQPPTKLEKKDFDSFVFTNSKDAYVKSIAMRLMSTPEYQMC